MLLLWWFAAMERPRGAATPLRVFSCPCTKDNNRGKILTMWKSPFLDFHVHYCYLENQNTWYLQQREYFVHFKLTVCWACAGFEAFAAACTRGKSYCGTAQWTTTCCAAGSQSAPCKVSPYLRTTWACYIQSLHHLHCSTIRQFTGFGKQRPSRKAFTSSIPPNQIGRWMLFAIAHCCHGWWACCRGFNQAVNGFPDDGWAAIVSDGMDDVSVLLNESPPTTKGMLGQVATDRLLCSLGGGILCAKASMLLQVAIMLTW